MARMTMTRIAVQVATAATAALLAGTGCEPVTQPHASDTRSCKPPAPLGWVAPEHAKVVGRKVAGCMVSQCYLLLRSNGKQEWYGIGTGGKGGGRAACAKHALGSRWSP